MTAGTPLPATPPDDDSKSSRQRAELGWWVAGTIVIIAIVIMAAVFLFGNGDGAPADPSHSVVEIVDDPQALLGERVVVAGRVEELLTNRALAIGSDRTDGTVLVLIGATATIGGYGIGGAAAAPLPIGTTYEPGRLTTLATAEPEAQATEQPTASSDAVATIAPG